MTYKAAMRLALVSFVAMLLHAEDAVSLTQYGLDLMDQGRFREAELPLLQALTLAGPDSSKAVYNLASLYHRQGRFAEAEKLHRQALDQIERRRGPSDLEVVPSLSDLGAIYRSQGRYSQSIAVLERAASILDENSGGELMATVLNNLGAAYYEIRLFAKAEETLRRALGFAQAGGDREHSEIPYILNTLGRSYVATKQYVRAELVYREAISLLAMSRGFQHPDYAMAQSNLAVAYQRQRRFHEALPLLESAINTLESSVGRDAPALAVPLETYTEVLKALGRRSEARETARRAKAIIRPDAGTVDVKALRER